MNMHRLDDPSYVEREYTSIDRRPSLYAAQAVVCVDRSEAA